MATILTLEEVSEQTKISVDTLRYWRKCGGGPKTFKLGRRVVVDQADLDAWIKARRAETESD